MVDFDIDKICRVCLRGDVDLSLLFDDQNAIDGISLSEMISECTMYTVLRHDEFPHFICSECISRVRNAYVFKKQFEASHRTLLGLLGSDHIFHDDRKSNMANDKCIQTEDSTLYPCEKCDEKLVTYERLREHRLTRHKGTANLCRICKKSFIRVADLRNHMAVCHPEFGHITPNECPICQKKFTRKDHVARHMKSVHALEEDDTEKKVENETLDETEVDFQNLTNPEADVELFSNCGGGECDDDESNSGRIGATNPFSSDEDEKPLSHILKEQSNAVERDIQVKLEPSEHVSTVLSPVQNPVKDENVTTEPPSKSSCRRYKCTECDKSFSRSSHVKRHLLSHKQDKPFACTVCDKRFSRADHLKTHLTKHNEDKPFKCDTCDRSYGRPDLLKRHKLQKHSIEKLGKTEVCDHCHKAFSSKNYLRRHMRMHSEKSWKCKWCLIQFESKESLREHVKSHNTEKPYLCSECGLRFIRNDYLRIHMRRHNGEKPYKCKYCDKGFPRATDLNVHERYHTGEKTHLCTTCGKGFQRAYNLVVHMRVHTGERPYKCPYCPKNFAQCNDLKAHVRRHTGERFKCEICGTGFIQGYNLTQHKLAVHGIEVESRIKRVAKVVTSNEPT